MKRGTKSINSNFEPFGKKIKFGEDITSFLKSLHTKNKIHYKLLYLTKTIISNSSPQFPKGMMSIGIS